ncbi:hypothetical protein [Candidatus Methylomirabilis sp.]|uniref:hypothetical protein n=1 Tax=Candidatus Methylomirabilis sp. TaxID=2032687 RepID=UPI002A5E7960|nr:FecR domain-containing protein [Candidatus Methylomirabilis sp.]
MRKQWRHRLIGVLFFTLTLFLFSPLLASAQESPVGVVTAIRGTAQLTASRLPTPTALHFKDDLFLHDIVDTQKDSVVRTLLGGKFTVTVRELTRFELREETLPTGATRSIFNLSTGKIRVSISRRLLSPGSEVLIQTPNAVAAVRGSTIIAQYIPELAHTIFSMISGEALITPLGQTPFALTFNKMVTTTGTQATGIQGGPVKEMTPAEVGKAQAGLNAGPSHKVENTQTQVETVTEMARTTTRPPALPTPSMSGTSSSGTSSSVGGVTQTTFPSARQIPQVVANPPPPPPSPPPPPPR